MKPKDIEIGKKYKNSYNLNCSKCVYLGCGDRTSRGTIKFMVILSCKHDPSLAGMKVVAYRSNPSFWACFSEK